MQTLRATVNGSPEAGQVACVALSAHQSLPFRDGAFDLAITIHFVSPPLFTELARILRPGGRLIFETFDGHGGNWRALPAPGDVRAQLEPHFTLLTYEERKVGPESSSAVVVKTLAERR